MSLLFWPFGSKKRRRVVLIYHSVGTGPWALSTEKFVQQLDWLEENADVVSLDALMIAVEGSDRPQVSITFDDGYQSLISVVAPLLSLRGWSATAYLNTGWMGIKQRKPSVEELGHYPKEEFLLWSEVKKLDSLDWTIGSHGVDHVDLTKTSHDETLSQLIESKRSIESMLDKRCDHFAYTWGINDRQLIEQVKNAGYKYASGAIHGPVKPSSPVHAIPRINIDKNYSIGDFESLIYGYWDYLGVFQGLKQLIRNIRNRWEK